MKDEFEKLLQDLDVDFNEESFEPNAPLPVDHDLIKRYLDNDLQEGSRKEVRRLIATYWDWQVEFQSLCVKSKPEMSLREEVAYYLGLEEKQLRREFFDHVDADDLVLRTGRNPLERFLPDIKKLVCPVWKQIDQTKRNDTMSVAIAVADALTVMGTGFPFPVCLVSVFLVKSGLNRLCEGYESES